MTGDDSNSGAYIEERPSGAHTITGVPSSVAAFVGFTARGPVNEPVQRFSFGDFERSFGGLHVESPLGYAVNHFFSNGGAACWIVRVASGAAAASVGLMTAPGGVLTLTATATSEGLWGNALVLQVDYATANPASTFNLGVTEMVDRGGRLVAARTETHRDLSLNAASGNYAVNVVNAASDLVELTDSGAPIAGRGESRSAPVANAVAGELDDDHRRLSISLDGGPFYEFDLFEPGGSLADLNAIAGRILTRVRTLEPATPAFDDFDCTIDANRILAQSGTSNDERSAVRFAPASVRSATAILRLGAAHGGRETTAAASVRPAATGTRGGRVDDFESIVFADPSRVAVALVDAADASVANLTVTLRDDAATPAIAAPGSLDAARARIVTALRASDNAAFAGATAGVVDGAIVVTPGGHTFSHRFEFTDADGTPATDLQLTNADAVPNVAAYQPGVGPSTQAQLAGTGGKDGNPPRIAEIQGSRAAKTGIFALEDVDIFNILNLPGVSDPSVLANAIAYAEERRSMILIDLPADVVTFDDAREWIHDPAIAGLRHRNAAAYFPRVRAADPLQDYRVRSFANSGIVAGLYARTDRAQGVWKAPAGIDASLRGVQGLEYDLSDQENGVLNPLALNALRTFPVYGSVCWGARTLMGADSLASEWKYIPVRRLGLFIEESLHRGTRFAVFEPNDAPLWAQLRLSVGSFMNNLFRQGAFQGRSSTEAYLVRCDSSTTTQADIDLGIVNILVGFAPLKPAEFVVLWIRQRSGRS